MINSNQTENELITTNVYNLLDIKEGMHVADLGCGNLGFFTFPTAKFVGKNGIVYAVDILRSVLDAVGNKAKQNNYQNVKTIWSNLEIVGATKIPAESLDLAFIHNVLFQSDKDEEVIKEAKRLLKPGAKLMVIDWLKIATPFGPPPHDRIDKKEVLEKASACGLRLEQEFSAGPYHFGLIFIK